MERKGQEMRKERGGRRKEREKKAEDGGRAKKGHYQGNRQEGEARREGVWGKESIKRKRKMVKKQLL